MLVQVVMVSVSSCVSLMWCRIFSPPLLTSWNGAAIPLSASSKTSTSSCPGAVSSSALAIRNWVNRTESRFTKGILDPYVAPPDEAQDVIAKRNRVGYLTLHR